MKRYVQYLLALLLVPLSVGLLYHNRHAWRPYDPTFDGSFPPGEDGDSAGWRETAQRYGWHLDYQEARRVAAESGKPLLVVIRCIP